MVFPESDAQRTLLEPASRRRLDICITNLLDQFGQPSSTYGTGKMLMYRRRFTEFNPADDEHNEYEQQICLWNMIHDTGSYAAGSYVEIWTDVTPSQTFDFKQPGLLAYHFQQAAILTNGEFYAQDAFKLFHVDGTPFRKWLSADRLFISSRERNQHKRMLAKERDNFISLLEPNFTQADFSGIMSVLTDFEPDQIVTEW